MPVTISLPSRLSCIFAARSGSRIKLLLAYCDGMLQHVSTIEMNDEQRWTAVAGRDRRADGSFYYAVTSTGVFCRPSCPSRRPRRDRVRFFATPREAEEAGYRPCLRCHPSSTARESGASAAIRRAAMYLTAHVDQPVSLADLGAIARL